MNYILFVDHVQEKSKDPIPKRRRTDMGETNISKGTGVKAMGVSTDVQPPKDNENEALGTSVLDKPLQSSCTNFALNSVETPSTSFNVTEGNNLLFYYTCKSFFQ